MSPGRGRPALVLASASPRRRAALRCARVAFESLDPGGDGPSDAADPAQRALERARHKARKGSRRRPGRPVLGADTVVFCGSAILEKPAGPKAARRMLRLLEGREHEVWTAACLLRPSGVALERADRAVVWFGRIPRGAMQAYIEGGEWRGLAGAYAIQGTAGRWGGLVTGDVETVVGLRTATVLDLLRVAAAAGPGAGGLSRPSETPRIRCRNHAVRPKRRRREGSSR